jgi:tRNA threonylcarbamoyladenosine biosynthesis protein TsaE
MNVVLNHLILNRTMDLTHASIVKTLLWRNEDSTQRFASAVAAAMLQQPLLRNAFVELRGDLGAGKTTLVRHWLKALGVQGRVKSPTYAVVETYSLENLTIWHFDFYRFSDPREWDDAGFRDLFASPGLKLAEWPDNAARHLPRADLLVLLEVLTDESRQVTLTAQSAVGVALMQAESGAQAATETLV